MTEKFDQHSAVRRPKNILNLLIKPFHKLKQIEKILLIIYQMIVFREKKFKFLIWVAEIVVLLMCCLIVPLVLKNLN